MRATKSTENVNIFEENKIKKIVWMNSFCGKYAPINTIDGVKGKLKKFSSKNKIVVVEKL